MQTYTLSLALVCSIAVHIEAVSIRPTRCPTNKIAPHRRFASWDESGIRDESNGRTFGAFYDLLVPERFQGQNDEPSSLQESPQNDPEDCGDIEEYDENDLSSLTPSGNRRQFGENRFFFGGYRPQRPNAYPQVPQTTYRPRPQGYPPKRPPQGGYFSQNEYRPPVEQNPSVYVKPVHEDNRERPQVPYRPSGVVGVPLGHIVGMNSLVPTQAPPTTRRPPPQRPFRPNQYYPEQAPEETHNNPPRRERPRTYTNNDSVLGSFVDLLFK